MGAIFGIINKNGSHIEGGIPNKAAQALAHRAVEGSIAWQDTNVLFWSSKQNAHAPQLPVETPHHIIIADAALHNRDSLLNLLDINKHDEESFTDTHLLLHAFEKWGKECVNFLNGEYAFAICNKQSHELFIATDHIGFRPLYYYDSNEHFIFCSEIKGVVAVKPSPNYFNESDLMAYHYLMPAHDQTFNKEIFALCGGSALSLENYKLGIKKYWVPKPLGKYKFVKDEDWIACLKELLYKAVEKRFNPDAPVGVTLSGGLDSTSVACILSELLIKKNKPLYAFSSVLPLGHTGVEDDERKYIEIVNKHCPNIIQTYVEAPNTGPLNEVEVAFEHDEAIPNAFFYMDEAILEAAKAKNISTLFTGFGGDYWVSWRGNSVIFQLINEGKYKQAFHLINKLSKGNKNFLQIVRAQYFAHTSAYRKIKKIIMPPQTDWQQQTSLKDSFVKQYPILDTSAQASQYQLNEMVGIIESGEIGRMESVFANRNAAYNMSTADVMFDKDILEFLMDVPVELFMKDGLDRSLIRHAMDGVIPKEIQQRKDKLPYSPDYSHRVLQSRQLFDEIIQAEAYDFVFDKYFDKDFIKSNFDLVAPHAGMESRTSLSGIRIAQAGITALVLRHLKNQGYLFT